MPTLPLFCTENIEPCPVVIRNAKYPDELPVCVIPNPYRLPRDVLLILPSGDIVRPLPIGVSVPNPIVPTLVDFIL